MLTIIASQNPFFKSFGQVFGQNAATLVGNTIYGRGNVQSYGRNAANEKHRYSSLNTRKVQPFSKLHQTQLKNFLMWLSQMRQPLCIFSCYFRAFSISVTYFQVLSVEEIEAFSSGVCTSIKSGPMDTASKSCPIFPAKNPHSRPA